jgi:hypothetical protein
MCFRTKIFRIKPLQTLLEIYSDHHNKDELWRDMFGRMVNGADTIYANSIFRFDPNLILDKNRICCPGGGAVKW